MIFTRLGSVGLVFPCLVCNYRFMVCIYKLMKRSDKRPLGWLHTMQSLKVLFNDYIDWLYDPLVMTKPHKKHIMWSGMHHCTGVNDYTRCKESKIKPVVPNKHFQPRNCRRLSRKYLTCGSARKCDYKMHCGFLLHFSDTILHLLSLQVIFFFCKLHVNI